MVYRFKVDYPLQEGTEERNAYIYLPKNYYKNEKKHYPVLYMFDGHNVFFDSDATYGKSWGLAEYLDKHRVPIIVAAVDCNHSPDHGRLKEYSPFTFKDVHLGTIVGRGKQTMEWYVNEFKKYVDTNYRTISDRKHTYIAGSSMGGLMTLYAVLEYNHVFSKGAALSPSLWTSPRQLRTMITHANIQPDTVLYMDYGSEEFRNHKNQRKAFGDIATLLMWHKINLNCRIVPDGNHSEASWEKQIPFFISTLLYRH